MKKIACLLIFLSTTSILSCSRSRIVELQGYPLNQINEVITRHNVAIDEEIKAEGTGCLRISATFPTVVKLFETGDIDVEGAKLVYRAKLKSEDLKGKAYLEMLVDSPEGEFYSRGLVAALQGTTPWTDESVQFDLRDGQNPTNVKLNVVVDGIGTVWVDDAKLLKAPLR